MRVDPHDSVTGFAHARWLRTSWTMYNGSSSGETHPAVGNVDTDGAAEIVIGLDSHAGEGGWFEVLDDAAANCSSVGWRNVDWPAFRASGGAAFPAVGKFQ